MNNSMNNNDQEQSKKNGFNETINKITNNN